MTKLPNESLACLTKHRVDRLTQINNEITHQNDLTDAIKILGSAAVRRHRYVKNQIMKIVAQYRDDDSVDKSDISDRRRRVKEFRKIENAAKTLRSAWLNLEVPDKFNLSIANEPKFYEIIQILENSGSDLIDLFDRLSISAQRAAKEIPGGKGGAPKKLALKYMARLCLQLYAEFREDRQSPSATTNSYIEFFHLVHQLATEDEKNLEPAAKDAYVDFKKHSGIFASRVKSKT